MASWQRNCVVWSLLAHISADEETDGAGNGVPRPKSLPRSAKPQTETHQVSATTIWGQNAQTQTPVWVFYIQPKPSAFLLMSPNHLPLRPTPISGHHTSISQRDGCHPLFLYLSPTLCHTSSRATWAPEQLALGLAVLDGTPSLPTTHPFLSHLEDLGQHDLIQEAFPDPLPDQHLCSRSNLKHHQTDHPTPSPW